MPYGSVTLRPGVNVEKTPTANEAGISQSSLVRFRDTLVQKLGGWAKFFSLAVAGVPRELHAWEDLNGVNHLAIGTTTQLGVITAGNYVDITPQTITSSFAPIVQTVAGSTAVTFTDANISNVTIYDSIYLNTPISAGGVILSGLYPIALITGTHSYNITAATAATTTNTLITNNTTAAGNNTLHFASVPAWVVAGMLITDVSTSGVIPADTVVLSTGGSTVVMSNNAAGAGVGNGDNVAFVSLPRFTTTSGSSIVAVELVAHGAVVNGGVFFPIATTGGGVTIQGHYPLIAVADANDFSIQVTGQASSSVTFDMNGGLAQVVYYITLAPPATGAGYGLGGYGSGGYGTGVTSSQQTGTEITATDWTSDNWGQILLACPSGGGVYQYDPTGGFGNAGLVASAPPFNGGIFVSVSQQILVCWGSSTPDTIGVLQDPMLVRWSTVGDYTNFQVLATDQAGSFRIPIGSKIMGGMAVSNQNFIWTDLDLWAMNYQGLPFVYGFNKIGAGAGLISSHAAQQLRGNVYWMGASNFYAFTGTGAAVLPCPVWDFVFQNLSAANVSKIRAMPNTPFNEVGWLFPSASSPNGECDSYVKFNITEPGAPWDYGPSGALPRSAWMDQTVLGPPIGANNGGVIYQHEISNDADGQPLTASFTTGYFYIAEGEDFAFVDEITPDFIYGTYAGNKTAQIQMTFNVINFQGDTPAVYGPYTVVQATAFTVRFRGRQMSITVQSSDLGSFWRLGKVRYRFSPTGRR